MKDKLLAVLAVAVIALLLLLVRENEQRVKAQSQLNDTRFKAVSVINEKGNAINELETLLAEQQAKTQQLREESEEMLLMKDQEMASYKAEAEEKQATLEAQLHDKESSLARVEGALKDTTARYDDELKKKNADLAEMGEQLRKTTERLASTLKKQQSLESETVNLRANVEGLERQVQALKAEKSRLNSEIKAALAKATTPAVTD